MNKPALKQGEYIWVLVADNNNNETYEIGKITSLNKSSIRVKFLDFNGTQTININSVSSNSVPLLRNMLNMKDVKKNNSNMKKILTNLENIKKLLKENPRSGPPPPPMALPRPPPPPPPSSKLPLSKPLSTSQLNAKKPPSIGNLAALVAEKARARKGFQLN